MESLKVGDIVARNSYECDIFFKVVNISNGIVTLKGICYRIEADAPMSDLVLQSDNYVRDYNRKVDSIVDKRVRNSSPIRASVCCCPFAIKKTPEIIIAIKTQDSLNPERYCISMETMNI